MGMPRQSWPRMGCILTHTYLTHTHTLFTHTHTLFLLKALSLALSDPVLSTVDCQLGSDEDTFSEVFLPTDSDYDSSEALSPRDPPDLYSPPQGLSQQAMYALGGSAPDVLQIHELR